MLEDIVYIALASVTFVAFFIVRELKDAVEEEQAESLKDDDK